MKEMINQIKIAKKITSLSALVATHNNVGVYEFVCVNSLEYVMREACECDPAWRRLAIWGARGSGFCLRMYAYGGKGLYGLPSSFKLVWTPRSYKQNGRPVRSAFFHFVNIITQQREIFSVSNNNVYFFIFRFVAKSIDLAAIASIVPKAARSEFNTLRASYSALQNS